MRNAGGRGEDEVAARRRSSSGSSGSRRKMKSGSGLPVFRRSAAVGAANRKVGRSCSPDRQAAASSLLRICLHAVACVASLVIGFRFSREALLVLVQPDVPVFKVPSRIIDQVSSSANSLSEAGVNLRFSSSSSIASAEFGKEAEDVQQVGRKSRRVHVGRHEILIRPWPHPDQVELSKAHALVQLVQKEQRMLYGPKGWRPVIAITTTFARTFQVIHLGGVLHTIRSVPGEVIWIVVEAGRNNNNDTASFLASSSGGVNYVHLVVKETMPAEWDQRKQMETRLRVEGLRHVRAQRLDGIIVFVDDSNVHSLELFDEVQKVNWLGALSVGLLQSGDGEGPQQTTTTSYSSSKQLLPVQGPACNESCHVVGWHAPRAAPVDDSALFVGVTDVARHLEWCGFVLNSRAIWEDSDKPEWIREWDEWVSGEADAVTSPLKLATDQAHVEALGNCGRDVLLWWIRVEARVDSRYPSRWELPEPLEVVVESKRTPWPPFVANKRRQQQLHRLSASSSSSSSSAAISVSSSSSSSSSRQQKQHSRRSKKRQQQQQQQQRLGVGKMET